METNIISKGVIEAIDAAADDNRLVVTGRKINVVRFVHLVGLDNNAVYMLGIPEGIASAVIPKTRSVRLYIKRKYPKLFPLLDDGCVFCLETRTIRARGDDSFAVTVSEMGIKIV